MTNMIEQVARAICTADANDWDTLTQSYNGRMRQHDLERYARAAIEAMREPTPDMVSAGGSTAFGGTRDDSFAELAEGMARDAYAAMIDAALTETTHSADHS